MSETKSNSQDLLTTPEAAQRLRLKESTLAIWRSQANPRGPKFVKLSGKVFYRLTDLEDYIEGNVQGGGGE